MPRPQLKDSFLKQAFSLSKKNTIIYYYDFCKDDEINLIIEKIKEEAKKSKKRIKILNKKVAGEIAPYKIRLRVDLRVLN
jgi:tRNA G37 N-methylase Trm5